MYLTRNVIPPNENSVNKYLAMMKDIRRIETKSYDPGEYDIERMLDIGVEQYQAWLEGSELC